MKKINALVCVFVILLGVFGTATINAAQDEGLGGYSWFKLSGHYKGTTEVNSGSGSLEINFKNIDFEDNAAGASTALAGDAAVPLVEDWTKYEALNFKITNPSSAELQVGVGICTGSNWYWHECPTISVPAGRSKEVSLDLHDAIWKTEATNWANTDTIADLDQIMKLDIKVMGNQATGKILFSDWDFGKSNESGGSHNPNPTPIPASGQFKIKDGQLFDANGNPFVMRGVNHAHTWYKTELRTTIPALAKAGCNTVRIVLSNGKQWTKDSASSVRDIISLCEQNKLITVLEVHDATGYNDTKSLLDAANYFVEIKDALVGKENTVIINIANEWQGEWNTSNWISSYKQAIAIIRNAGFEHTIMVDAGGWGQHGQSVIDGGKEVFDSDPLANTMFAIHMYGTAGGTASIIKNNINGVINQGLALCIGEFGWNHSDGDVDEATIMSYCQEKNVGWLAWSWKGNGGGVEYLDMSNDWAGNNLSEWGDTVVNGPNGLKETSQICTVFTDNDPRPTPTPTQGQKGDLNGDNEINSMDLTVLKRYLLKAIDTLPVDNAMADLNEDGKVDTMDLTLLKRLILKNMS